MTPNGAAPDQKRTADPDQIKAEIDATREQLARTVDELSARLDVPARARARATESAARARDTAVETYRELPSLVLGGAIALVGLVAGLVIWRRKRATSREEAVSALRRRR
jgi:LPXTG-motif cell wall-anchored protein